MTSNEDVEDLRQDKRTLVLRLRDRMALLIRNEKLSPGDRLPSEAELTKRFGVSRPALREALKLLEQDGLIFVEHGRGRFVSAISAVQVQRPITVFESVSEMTRHYGYSLVNKVLSVAEVSPPTSVWESLSLPPGAPVIRLERLRFENDVPLMYCVDYIPRHIIPTSLDAVRWEGSLLDLLGTCMQRPRMSAASVTAVFLPAEVVDMNGLQDFGPALLISETCFNSSGQPVNYAMVYHRGTHFSFSLART